MAANEDRTMGCSGASAPPATTTSASPRRINSAAVTRAWVPEEQALTVACTPRRALTSSATAAAEPLPIDIGTVMGGTRRQPRVLRVSQPSMIEVMSPSAAETTTATRLGAVVPSSRPASAQASAAAVTANWAERLRRRRCRCSSPAPGSTFARPPSSGGRSLAHDSSSSSPSPLSPRSIASQVVATVPPSGVVSPRPVTTTLWFSSWRVFIGCALPVRAVRRAFRSPS